MNSPVPKSMRILLVVASTTFSFAANAQNMNIVSSNGTNQVIDLTTIESMVFKNGNMIVKDADCGDRYFSQFFVTTINIGATAGLNEFAAASGINVYPNPVADQMTIVRNQSGKATVEITTLLGEKVSAFDVSDQSVSTSLSGMTPGVYFLKVDQQCIKFVKQ
ncbi:T9SS type A sorting domain-containing protein [Fluviicola sp.]|uniref:T9SS type A sorting domain-containing protein n=1 Tax=Fluviicola sp. TaxID=1917219 RepID=UPI0031D8357D